MMGLDLDSSRRWMGFLALLGLFMGCPGGQEKRLGAPGPPGAPTIVLPATSEVGSQVTGSVQGADSGLLYCWTITHESIPGHSLTLQGPQASFSPSTTGPARFSCVATRGGSLVSDSTEARVRIHAKLAPGTFLSAGHLLEPRKGMAAALLPTGQVLVLGGSTRPRGGSTSSAELYTPSTQRSVPTHAMVFGRVGHALASLGNGLFLVTGGADRPAAAEVYDSASGVCTSVSSMGCERSGHTATFLASPPAVLIAGGLGSGSCPVPVLEVFHPSTGAFSPRAPARLAPGHTATLPGNGKVLLVSHTTERGVWHPWAALYDPARGALTPTSGLPGLAREGQQALLLVNPPRVLLLGGNDGRGPTAYAEYYDPALDAFQPCPEPMLAPRQDFGATLLPGGEVLILGGTHDGVLACSSAERFDPVSQTFAPTADLDRPRRHPLVLGLPSGQALVLGGSNEVQGCLAEVETYGLIQPPERIPKPWRPVLEPSPEPDLPEETLAR